jgi:hypothetical protein
MKKLFLVGIMAFLFQGMMMGQDQEISHKFGIGFQLNQFQKDFGLGINVTSPYFAGKHVAIRLRANYMYFEHINDAKTIWSPYTNISLGVIGVAGTICDFIQLYGEGGFIGLLPSDKFSSENFVLGGYGIFGFEFYLQKNFNYFIELGGIGTGATADKLINKPTYSNGFMISTGLRIQLK